MELRSKKASREENEERGQLLTNLPNCGSDLRSMLNRLHKEGAGNLQTKILGGKNAFSC